MTDQALDDLTTADQKLGAAVDAAIAAIKAQALALSSANAAGANDPAIETIAQDIAAKADALTAAITPTTDTGGGSTSAGDAPATSAEAAPPAGSDTSGASTTSVAAA